LRGKSPNADTLARPGSMPAIVADDAEIVTTSAPSGATEEKKRTRAPAPRLTPATPPAWMPWGRTETAGKCSSCASLVTNTSSSVSAPWRAPTTSSPFFSAMTSNSGFAGSADGAMRFTTPCRVPSAMASSVPRATRATTRSFLSVSPR
jgi:hypothetical protein